MSQVITPVVATEEQPAPLASPPTFRPEAPMPVPPSPPRSNWYQRNRELCWSLLAGVFLLIGWAGERWFDLPHSLALLAFAGAYGFGAFDLLRHLTEHLRKREFSFNIDLLMLVAAVGAAALGEYAEGAFLLFLFSLAHALEHAAMGRARHAIAALAELAPTTARVRRNGQESEIPIEQVQVGDVVIVLPAERIPVDGRVLQGQSAVDQAPITGESVPVDKGVDASVYAGSINGQGALTVETQHAAGDRTLDRVIQLVEAAEQQQAPTQAATQRFERIFVPSVLLIDVLIITIPPLLGWWSWSTSFYRGMALLVAASPCALAIGTPAAVLSGIAQAARHGVLIKGGAFLEALGQLRAIAFDKTGTLTQGQPQVTDILALPEVNPVDLLAIAAAVERQSQHPLAKAIVLRAEHDQIMIPQAQDLQSQTARGVQAQVERSIVQLGNLRLWQDQQTEIPSEITDRVEQLQQSGKTIVVIRQDAAWLGVIGVADQPRPGVSEVLQHLRKLGIAPLVMLTGDNAAVGKAIGQAVGVDEVRADLLPEDKVRSIEELRSTFTYVGMVGDGVNDAPALATATVGIAMGAAGTAAALETADVALMADDLSQLPYAIGLSRKARSIIRQNLVVALGVIAVLIIATTTGFFGIGAAVVLHEGSTLVVVANALRLLTFAPKKRSAGT